MPQFPYRNVLILFLGAAGKALLRNAEDDQRGIYITVADPRGAVNFRSLIRTIKRHGYARFFGDEINGITLQSIHAIIIGANEKEQVVEIQDPKSRAAVLLHAARDRNIPIFTQQEVTQYFPIALNKPPG